MANNVLKKVGNAMEQVAPLKATAGRAGADTIKLWEGYREQAYMWRALSLIQMPATFLSIAAALVMYFFADTIIEVPERPQPGFYSIKQLPDSQFIDAATNLVNLVATYQPAVARRQFKMAQKYLWEPALTEFQTKMMGPEINSIEQTKRSQMFFINPRLIKVNRYPDYDRVIVRVPGLRQKLIGDKAQQPEEMVYYIKMTTIPRNVSNEYGIVVVDIHLRYAGEKEVMIEDEKEDRALLREQKAAPAAK